jgi:hypothetical protein
MSIDCFGFFPEEDSTAQIHHEIVEFLDTPDWQELMGSLSNNLAECRDSVLQSIVKKINSGIVSAELGFSSFSVSFLVNQMVSAFDPPLFKIAVQLSAHGFLPAKLFLEQLIQLAPDKIATALPVLNLNPHSLSPLVLSMVMTFHRHPSLALQRLLDTIPLELLLHEMRRFVKTLPDCDFKELCKLLTHYHLQNSIFPLLERELHSALSESNSGFLNLLLDFLYHGLTTAAFNYSQAFTAIFESCKSPLLASVLAQRAPSTEDSVLQIQCAVLDEKSTAPLKDLLRSRSAANDSVSDQDIFRFAQEFSRTKVIPPGLRAKLMFDKTSIIALLRKHSRGDPLVQRLADEMERTKMIPRPPTSLPWEQSVKQLQSSDTPLSGITEILEQSRARYDLAAPELFNSFHIALHTRHAGDVVEFADQFESKVIQPMPYAKQDQLCELAVRFLCANLAGQHRESLSILAVRCAMAKFAPLIFECAPDREVEVLVGLHRAALTSALFLRLGGPKPLKTSSHLELAPPPCATGVVTMDRVVILRLRWRILRGDSGDETCFLPEFLQLCESDPVLFLRWECQSAESSAQRLARLGIAGNSAMMPQFLAELLRSDRMPAESLVEAMAPLLSRIPPSLVGVPEAPNLELLFRLDCLWCRPVMFNPRVVESLRDASVGVSQALLRALPIADDVEALFMQFPHAFAAMLANFPQLLGDRQRALCDAHQTFVGRSRIYRDAPRFTVVAVVAMVAKRGEDLLQFAETMDGFDWVKYCLFFAICHGKFEAAVQILGKWNGLFPFLREGVEEEVTFLEHTTWTEARIRFAFYCARNEVDFAEREEWKSFLNAVRIADWPDALTIDSQNFRIFDGDRNAIDK